jgi:hypothetical protein
MKKEAPATDRGFRTGLYLGATLTAALVLMPGNGALGILGMVAGPLVAVLVASRTAEHRVNFGRGADLGFRTTFYGILAAYTIYDLVWHVWGYRLWKIENLDRVISWVAETMRDWSSPRMWIVLTVQMITTAIFAGIFGAPSGLLGAKLFSRAAS